jgi:hypothetical protein
MTQKGQRLRIYFTDRRISLIIRWWAAGAVYFFIGWGTMLGTQQSTIDFVFALGLVMGLFNILIINPGLRLLFNIGRKRPPHENTFWQRISDHLVELLKNIFIMFVIAMIYRMINQVLISLLALPADSVPLPGEPILFGVFYVFVFVCLEWVTTKTRTAILNFRDGKAQ